MAIAVRTESVRIPSAGLFVDGDLRVPPDARGLVLFAHGSGSSRFSRRNRHVATFLERQGFATLLLDLLTPEEEAIDERTAEYRFDIARLADRVIAAIDWVADRPDVRLHPLGCFGASTGAAAALIAAAQRPGHVRAVVSRGGRPDLAASALAHVRAPTLLIVGGLDEVVIDMNRSAMARMPGTVELAIVPGATHLFEEPGTLDQVCELAGRWCATHLVGAGADAPGEDRATDSAHASVQSVSSAYRAAKGQQDALLGTAHEWAARFDRLAAALSSRPERLIVDPAEQTFENAIDWEIVPSTALPTIDELRRLTTSIREVGATLQSLRERLILMGHADLVESPGQFFE